MPWAPGQSGNPNGYSGPRNRRRHEVFEIIKNLGHKDALETLSYLQHNEQIEPGLRIAAAAALAPFCHPKMQATPTPRYVECEIDAPSEFTHVSGAEAFPCRDRSARCTRTSRYSIRPRAFFTRKDMDRFSTRTFWPIVQPDC